MARLVSTALVFHGLVTILNLRPNVASLFNDTHSLADDAAEIIYKADDGLADSAGDLTIDDIISNGPVSRDRVEDRDKNISAVSETSKGSTTTQPEEDQGWIPYVIAAAMAMVCGAIGLSLCICVRRQRIKKAMRDPSPSELRAGSHSGSGFEDSTHSRDQPWPSVSRGLWASPSVHDLSRHSPTQSPLHKMEPQKLAKSEKLSVREEKSQKAVCPVAKSGRTDSSKKSKSLPEAPETASKKLLTAAQPAEASSKGKAAASPHLQVSVTVSANPLDDHLH